MLLLTLSGCGIDNNIKKGEKYLALGEYYDAADEFKQAYSKTPSKDREKRGKMAVKIAYCYNRINSTQKAQAAYRNAIRYNKATLANHLSFARQLLKTASYKEAEKEFLLVMDSLKTMKSSDPAMQQLAENGLKSARMASKWKKDGSRYNVRRMDIFNSRRDDYCPMLTGDQYDQLYFSSTRNESQGSEASGITGTKASDIYVSTKDEKGKWQRPEAAQGGLNTEAEEATSAFTADGRDMYITQCTVDPSYPRYAKIAKSARADATWGNASVVEITHDTLSSYAHPAVSPDGNWLYFTSDMPGGFGGKDIWRVRLTAAGLGAVENAGPIINTAGDEMFPSFRPNGDLYFASDGHPGLGGLDIFIASVGKDKRWVLEHPGYPLNSNGDDFGITFEGHLNKGFFSSNRNDQGHGWDKIYSFENPEIVQTVKGWVYERDGYELPQALVYFVGNDGTNERISVKGDGSFEQRIDPDVDYVILATCKGYLNHKEEIKVEPVTESKEYVLQFPLVNISVPTLINNIFYDFDKATLKPESSVALDTLVVLLKENPNITIELSAHCDYRGSDEYNVLLSQHRAESVVNYLRTHGIAADRLTAKGYGKSRPKTIRKRLTETYPWLKEGDVLTEEFIVKLPKEQQEICNQLNRRTEFTVLRTTYGLFDKNGKLRKDLPVKKSEEPKKESSGIEVFE